MIYPSIPRYGIAEDLDDLMNSERLFYHLYDLNKEEMPSEEEWEVRMDELELQTWQTPEEGRRQQPSGQPHGQPKGQPYGQPSGQEPIGNPSGQEPSGKQPLSDQESSLGVTEDSKSTKTEL